MNCELVLLAAGQARRFGSDKRFALLANGQAMWRASLQIYLDAGLSGYLVVGENESAQFQGLPDCIQLHECAEARDGMSRSLACGLQQVRADFALVALADMPFLRTDTVQALVNAAENTGAVKAVQACHEEKSGHPKLLSRDLFNDICVLDGDRGGFSVLQKLSGSELLKLNVNDPGILRDVDRPQDLQSPTH